MARFSRLQPEERTESRMVRSIRSPASFVPGKCLGIRTNYDNYRAFCYLLNFSSDYLVTGECPHSLLNSAAIARNLFICVPGQFVCNYLNLISVANNSKHFEAFPKFLPDK